MSVRNLQKRSGTDWARIDEMTDDEIDRSDIPPLDEAFFKSAKWLLPRWCIDLGDFKQANEFAGHILKRKWRNELNETPVKKLEHRAFNTSLIVSYARPFHNNNNYGDAPKSSLRKQVAKLLDETEIKLHRRILELRDTVCAHSDASAHLFGEPKGYQTLIFTRVIENLSESEVRLLKRMTKKWIDYLGIERSKLKGRLAQALQADSNRTAPVQNHARAKR